MAPILAVHNLEHRYPSPSNAGTITGGGVGGARGGGHVAVQLSFTVDPGELVCLVGPSGCGKSTLLRSIAGLLTPTTGTITLHGQSVHPAGPARGAPTDLAVVFQDYSRSLYPWLTARGNIEFALHGRQQGRQHRRLRRAERRARATDALGWVGLDDVGGRRPWQLSGGMQQRVAIARALVCEPALLLMDEPFASVDAHTRAGLEDLLLRVRRERTSTVLLVTHDIDEAVYLADRVLVLSPAPARIIADLPVDLPQPRDQITTRESARFVEVRTQVARLLHPCTTTPTNPPTNPPTGPQVHPDPGVGAESPVRVALDGGSNS